MEQFKKMAAEAIMEAHKAQSNAIAMTKMFQLIIEKYHPEFREEFISEYIKERDKAMAELISNSEAIPAHLKDAALQKLKEK